VEPAPVQEPPLIPLTFNHGPATVQARLPVRDRLALAVAAAFNARDFARYRVNLFAAGPAT
jgi:hypothetical protein